MFHVANIFMYGIKLTDEQWLDFLESENLSDDEEEELVAELARNRNLVYLDVNDPNSSWILGVPVESPMPLPSGMDYQEEYFDFMSQYFKTLPENVYSAFYSELMTY